MHFALIAFSATLVTACSESQGAIEAAVGPAPISVETNEEPGSEKESLTSSQGAPEISAAKMEELLSEEIAIDAEFYDLNEVSRDDEVPSLRRANSYTFQRFDGQLVSLISLEALNYEDEDGHFRPIDLVLVKTPVGWENSRNSVQVSLPESSGGAGISVDSSKADGIQMWAETKMVLLDESLKTLAVQKPAKVSGAATSDGVSFSETYPGVAEKFSTIAGGIKYDLHLEREEIFWAGKVGYLAFCENVTLPEGWYFSAGGVKQTGTFETSGDIVVHDDEGNPWYAFEAPRIFEAGGEEDENPDGAADEIAGRYLVRKKGIVWEVLVLTDLGWLNDPERDYPVVIDPTTKYYPSVASMWTGYVNNGGTKSSGAIRVGNDSGTLYNGWMKFDISGVTDGSTIADVALSYLVTSDGNANVDAKVYDISSDPVAAAGAALYADAEAGSVYDTDNNVDSVGWRTRTLSSQARADLQNLLGSDWFAVGIDPYANVAGAGNYVSISGYDAGASYIPYITVTYATPALSYEWAGAGNVEGWTIGNAMSSLTCDGTYMNAVISGSDPHTYGPAVSFSGTTYKTLHIRALIPSGIDFDIYFITAADGTFDETKKVRLSVPDNTNFYDYYFPMSTAAGWTGQTITQLRMDPGWGSSGTAQFDFFRMESGPAGLWIGKTSTAWATATNWADGNVPGASTDVRIYKNAENWPTMSSSTSVGSIYVESGATLTITATDNWVTVAGNLIVESGATLSHQTNWSTTYGLQVGGDFTIDGTYSYPANYPLVYLYGSGTHYIRGTGLGYLCFNNGDFYASGTISCNADLWAMWSATGSLHTNGYSVSSITGAYINGGTLYVEGGTFATPSLVLGWSSGLTATVNMSAGTMNVTGNLYVAGGGSQTGVLTQSAGTINVSANVYVGYGASSSGTYNISNAAIIICSGSVYNAYGASSTGAINQSNTCTILIALDFDNGSGGTLTCTNTPAIALQRDWINDGTFNYGQSLVFFYGGNSCSIGGATVPGFYDLTFSKDSAAQTISVAQGMSVANDFAMYEGTWDVGPGTTSNTWHWISGDCDIEGGTITMNAGVGNQDVIRVLGNVVINGGTFGAMASGSSAWLCEGNWTFGASANVNMGSTGAVYFGKIEGDQAKTTAYTDSSGVCSLPVVIVSGGSTTNLASNLVANSSIQVMTGWGAPTIACTLNIGAYSLSTVSLAIGTQNGVSGTVTMFSNSSALDVTYTLSISSGATLDCNNGTPYSASITVGLNWTQDGTFDAGGSTVTFDDTNDTTISGAGTFTFRNMTIVKTDVADQVIANAKHFDLTGSLTITKGTLTLGATDDDFEIDGALTCSTRGAINHNVDWDTWYKALIVGGNFDFQGTYSYTGRGHVQLDSNGSATSRNVRCTNGVCILTLMYGDFYANGAVVVDNDFWPMFGTSGSFHTNGQTVTASAGTYTSGGTLYIDGGTLNAQQVYVGHGTLGGSLVVSSGTLNSTGEIRIGNQSGLDGTASLTGGTISATNYYNSYHGDADGTTTLAGATLNLSGNFYNRYDTSGTNACAFTISDAGAVMNVAGDFENKTGATFTCTAAGNAYIGGDWTNNGTFTAGSGTFTFDEGTNSYISGSSRTFGNLVFDKDSVTDVITTSGALTVNSNLTLTEGEWNTGGFIHAVIGNFVVDGGQVTMSAGSQEGVYTYGNVTIEGGSHPTPGNEYSGYTCEGNWTFGPSAVFDPGKGAVVIGQYVGTSARTCTITDNSGGNCVFPQLFIAGGCTANLATDISAGACDAPSTLAPSPTLMATLNVGANTLTTGALNVNLVNGVSATINLLDDDATLDVAGALTIASTGVIDCESGSAYAASIEVGGNWTNDGTFDPGSSTVTFDGTVAISGSATHDFSGITIAGTLTAPAQLYISGDFSNDGTFSSNGGDVTFDGSTTVSGSVGTTFEDVTITGSVTAATATTFGPTTLTGGSMTVNAAKSITIAGDFTESGTSSVTVQPRGSLKLDGADANALPTTIDTLDLQMNALNASQVVFQRAGSQIVPALTYKILQIAGTGTKTCAGNVDVDWSMTINTATFDIGNYDLNLGASFTNNGGFTQGSGMVTFDDTTGGIMMIGGDPIGGTSVTTFEDVTIADDCQMNANINMSTLLLSGALLNVKAKTLTIAGDFTEAGNTTLQINSGGVLNVGGSGANALPASINTTTLNANSTIDFTGGAAQTIPVDTYGNLTISGTGVRSIAGDVVIAGNLLVSAGTFDNATFDVRVGGTVTVNDTMQIAGADSLNPARLLKNGGGTLSIVQGANATIGFIDVINHDATADPTAFAISAGGAGAQILFQRPSFDEFQVGWSAYVDFITGYTGNIIAMEDPDFENNSFAASPRNVKVADAASPMVIVMGGRGLIHGEEFDVDQYARVRWYVGPPEYEIVETGATYSEISDAIAAASAGQTVRGTTGMPTFEDVVVDKAITLEELLVVGDVICNVDTASIRNCFIEGDLGTVGGEFRYVYHCSVNGNIHVTGSSGAGAASWNILTGSVTLASGASASLNLDGITPANYWTNPSLWDYHLVSSAASAINSAAGSTVTRDFDGQARPGVDASPDIGADERISSGLGDVVWESGALGPVNHSYISYWGDSLYWMATANSEGAGDWSNAIVALDSGTGAVIAGLRGSGTNTGFANSLVTFSGAATSVNVLNVSSGKYDIYVTYDSSADGRADKLSKIRASYSGALSSANRPTWSGASVEWTFTASEGPISAPAFNFVSAGIFDVYFIADSNSSGTNGTGNTNPVIYRVDNDPLSGGYGTASASSQRAGVPHYDYQYGASVFVTGEITCALKSNVSADYDVVRLDASDFTAMDEHDVGINGLVAAPTPANLGTREMWLLGGDDTFYRVDMAVPENSSPFDPFDIGTGIAAVDDAAEIVAPPRTMFNTPWIFGGYEESGRSYLFKIDHTSGGTDDDWIASAGARDDQTMIGSVLSSGVWYDRLNDHVWCVTDLGYLYAFYCPNVAAASGDDGTVRAGYPVRISDANVRYIKWGFNTPVPVIYLSLESGRTIAIRIK
ncbi:MAG: hypothetical protein NUW37_04670 [Planctomycetes bacterium]|nr:hypothetical protein [Planctomycetota bacterium]